MGLYLGGLLGEVKEIDAGKGGDCLGQFIHVRILVDVTKPLRRGLRVAFRMGEEVCNVMACYERLPNFYYYCGLIGTYLTIVQNFNTGAEKSSNKETYSSDNENVHRQTVILTKDVSTSKRDLLVVKETRGVDTIMDKSLNFMGADKTNTVSQNEGGDMAPFDVAEGEVLLIDSIEGSCTDTRTNLPETTSSDKFTSIQQQEIAKEKGLNTSKIGKWKKVAREKSSIVKN
ncbi:hypothetical protein LWI28_003733 [Acer negundo]|uniref:Zinc knuckle CX2CX4HX4C domain-containing protein n=1 Tax=Acer negundo TaxID=4023 RepID=A0AAD5IIK6_ACENE|nr:hypothetical protein LWI28_003733 [Acer negundo]